MTLGAFNPSTTFNIRRKDIVYRSYLNDKGQEERFCIINADKGRSNNTQIAVFPVDDSDPLNPANIFTFISTWLERFEHHTNYSGDDYVFLYRPRGTHELKPYDRTDLPRQHFISKYKLPEFALEDIRQAVLDMAGGLVNGDLVTLQKLAQHVSVATTFRNYSSSSLVADAQETFAFYLAMRDRWYESSGNIDPRDQHASSNFLAATPGFLCLDVLDSPIVTEVKGKPCKSYGACPSCPLAAVDLTSPYVLLRLLQLREVIFESVDTMSPARWSSTWLPRLNALRAFIGLFPDNIIEHARRSAQPGPLPPLE